MKKIQKLLRMHGRLYSEILGIRPGLSSEETFRWFLASVLFGAPIRESTAMKTFSLFDKEGLTSPRAIVNAGWDRLVQILDEGGYTRYDFKTADKLLELCNNLLHEYGGSIEAIKERSKDKKELKERLKSLARGIGDSTIRIFLREMYPRWGIDPGHSPYAILAAKELGIRIPKRFNPRLEVALMRFGRKLKKVNRNASL